MQITSTELKNIQKAGLSLEEAFYLWNLTQQGELELKLNRASEEKLTKLGFLSQGKITEECAMFFASLDGQTLPNSTRFDEFFQEFPIDESTPPTYVPTRPRPIRIGRGIAEVEYRKKLSKGFSEEELIRAVRNYKDFLRRTDKEGKPFKYMRSPKSFLQDDYFSIFINTSHPAYEVLTRFKKRQNANYTRK